MVRWRYGLVNTYALIQDALAGIGHGWEQAVACEIADLGLSKTTTMLASESKSMQTSGACRGRRLGRGVALG